jgi:anti-sigma factor RsiW
MTDRWSERLSEYVDGELDPATVRDLESHLQGCAACTTTLEGLRAVAGRARALDAPVPPEDLWPAIAARIADRGAARFPWRVPGWRFTFTFPQLAAAALALIALSAGTVWMTLRGGLPTAPGSARGSGGIARSAPPAARPGAEAPAVVADFGVARYDAAIADLERTLNERRGQLDTTTVRVVEQNLAIIDRAIEQARRALAADPTDLYLNNHLASTMRRKVDLLRLATTASFPS